jgi:ABC-2 type transport system ATP-binding protein
MTETLARAVEVTRRYGDVVALDTTSLDIHAGELIGLLGPNGAGKSTLVNLLCGLRRPSSGTVTLFGGPPGDPARRRSLGMTPQETGLPPTLRVRECVDFVAAHFPSRADRDELLGRFGVADLRDRQIGGLSGGQKRRVAVALAFAGRPRMVLLDEPTTGLDVEARRALWEGIRDFHAGGGTVLLTSHYLEEIEALAERVVVLGQGRVLADDTLGAVRGMVGVRRVSLNAGRLPELPDVLGVEHDGERTHLLTSDADRLVRELVISDVPFSDLEIRATTLEEAFLAITARPAEPAASV